MQTPGLGVTQIPEFFETREDIRSYLHGLAAELGLHIVKRQSQRMLGAYTRNPLGLEGEVEGMPMSGTVAITWGPTAAVTFEVALRPQLWADLVVRGRATPLYEPDDFLAEFEIETTDNSFANGLFDAALKRALLEANRAGFYPVVTDSHVQLNAIGLGAPREVRDCIRSATRIAKQLREKHASFTRSRVHARVVEAWLTAASHFGAKLDEASLVLTLPLSFGHLELRAAHPSYRRWRTELNVILDPPLAGELRVTTYGGNWERWFAPDIKFGDPAFDDHFLVRADAREHAERILSSAARAALLGLAAHMPELLVTEGGIHANRAGLLDSVADCKLVLDAALGIADELLRQRETRTAYR